MAATPALLKLRYPAFTAVDVPVIQYWITDAGRTVDASWSDTDRDVATMALAAHNMVLRGLGTDEAAASIRDGTAGFRRIRSGSVDIERLDKATSQARDQYQQTPYGPEYLELLYRNRGGPRVTSPGAAIGLNAGFNGFAGPLPYPARIWGF